MSSPALQLGMSEQEFLTRYWQRRPLLVRGAMSGLEGRIDADELAGLACEDWVESRIVTGPVDDHWHLEHGPIAESRFEGLGDRDWTLLIQDCDKLLPEVSELLEAFRFLPDWRIDDIMVSFAAPGGSVGPHWDHYDVFLIQAQGRRRWLIDDRPDPDLTYRDGEPLKLLERFHPTREWVLEPGDLLYLPPEVPHHGIALDPCLTCSVGMRAPSDEELLIDFAEHVAAGLTDRQRYRDPDLEPAEDPGRIDDQALAALREHLQNSLDPDDDAFRRWAGEFLTRYRLAHAVAPNPAFEPAELSGPLARNPWSRLAWTTDSGGALLFASGECFRCRAETAALLCRQRSLDAGEVARITSEPVDRAALQALVEAGHWVPADA